ncbi:MAG: hypothetical protein KDD22_02290, partial [Bdellovibrionales bacterium]|nr:hypothetical protein [Bdellovibrionales bacterium]
FRAVKVRGKDRVYKDTYVMDDLSFTTTYRSSTANFSITISPVDDDGVAMTPTLEANAKLRAGEYWRVKTINAEEKALELYCYFIPDSK